MADELNIPSHRWYQPRNNIKLAPEDTSQKYIYDSGIQKIDAWINSQPWGVGSLFAYAAAGITPQLVSDFKTGTYGKAGALSTFDGLLEHSRASDATYVDSTGTLQTAASGVARENHHVWNGSAWVKEGYLHEPEAATNLLLNSDVIEQKEIAVTPQTYTLSFNSGSQFKSEVMGDIAATAVDVFVYDTTKDSDGGAWRTGALAQASSWYNETLNTATRGSRQEFPAIAIIVAEAGKVTIYDGDDPALPMWMVFNVSTSHSLFIASTGGGPFVHMLNGVFIAGTSGITSNGTVNGLSVANFVSDIQSKYDEAGFKVSPIGIYDRNNTGLGLWWYTTLPVVGPGIVSQYINDVAMTVLPDAPIDPATGLPVPTIAVGCGVTGQANGGTSIIHNDGTVVDIVATTSAGGYACYDLAFGPNHELITTQSYARSYLYVHVFDVLPTSDIATTISPAGARTYSYSTGYPSFRGSLGANPEVDSIVAASGEIIGGGDAGTDTKLMRLFEDKSTKANGMVAYTTSTYNTGWMNGDIKGAFLSSTDATSLVGADLYTGTVNTVLGDWTESGGVVTMSGTTTTSSVSFNLSTPTVVGKQYVVTISGSVSGGSFYIDFGPGTGASQLGDLSSVGTFFLTANNATSLIRVGRWTGSPSGTLEITAMELADEDRSVNNNGLIVNGTITRAPVATGAELVAYSGFSASNYLEQPYNADLDFGTGDFCVMGWVKATDTGNIAIFSRADAALSATQFRLYLSAGQIVTTCGSSTAVLTDGLAYNSGSWQFVSVIRQSGIEYVYANGSLIVSRARAGSVTNTAATTRFGLFQNDTSPLTTGSLALWRISATAPTAAQIAKIYNDEKVLFQENAACTLYGTSDAVTALAHDSDINLLHVGTSAGRSVFDGLRRIDNTTDPITTAISVVGGYIAEE